MQEPGLHRERGETPTAGGSAGGGGAGAAAGCPGLGRSAPRRTICETEHLNDVGKPWGS